LHTIVNIMTLLFTKYYQSWSMSVEDIASQSSVILEQDWKTHFRGLWFPR